MTATADGEFAMRGLSPYPELVAYAQPGPDGTIPTDRRGSPKVRRVQLRAPNQAPPARPDGLADNEWQWAIRTTRRWSTLVDKLGDRATDLTRQLAEHNCGSLDCDFSRGRVITPPRQWIPHPTLAAQEQQRRQERHDQQRDLTARADQLRPHLRSTWPGVAGSLNTNPHDPRLPWLVAAANDLSDGTYHDSLRAFVQCHAAHTKVRDDVHKLLLEAGWEPEAVSELGINRNPYLGVGGPILAVHHGRTLDWTGWPGPHDIRLPADHSVTLRTHEHVTTLLVIENRQAAETACDRWPEAAVIWCHGQPADAAVEAIGQAASTVDRVIICTDADLGGVRIAARVDDEIPSHLPRILVDAGAVDHPTGTPFSDDTRTHLAHIAQRRDAVGTFAATCLHRGYAVEQEAPIRAALRAAYEL